MKLGILICSCNRPKYLQECFDSLLRANIPDDTLVVVSDDCSSDTETKKILEECAVTVLRKEKKGGIWDSMTTGIEYLFDNGCDVIINLDSDAVVSNNFVDVLLTLKKNNPDRIITGFNSKTKNKDGSERHTVIGSGEGYELKKSVGGLNMVFDKEIYEKYMKTALINQGRGGDNWDRQACIASMKDDKSIVCSVPSVVNHIGIVSAMGHAGGGEPMDIAEDFKPLHLPMVTLIGATGFDAREAVDISSKHIEFGAIKVLDPFASKALYNKFILKQLSEHFETSHCLLVQPDGYVVNWKAWSDEFLQYDYIGARWHFNHPEYPNFNVGNGGFSLRSRRLCDILHNDEKIIPTNDRYIKNFEEDHNISKIYRKYLEETYDIKFAPPEVADKFSIEVYGVRPPGNKYAGSFGFHGHGNIDWSGATIEHIPQRTTKQFAR